MKANEIMEKLFTLALKDREFNPNGDCCKEGNPEKEIQKLAVTTFPSTDTIKAAAEWGADMLLVHEPLYYDHLDAYSTKKLQTQKRELIEQSGMTVCRFHDHAHFCPEDLIAVGMVRQMGFDADVEYITPGNNTKLTLKTPMTAAEVAKQLEKNLNLRHIRICGARDIPATTITGMFGAPDGVLDLLQADDTQIIIVGETCEWMMAEYARDAGLMGHNKTLLILGHAGSEEAGMVYISDLIAEMMPELTVKYFPCGEVYTYTDSE